jgi:predicted permease
MRLVKKLRLRVRSLFRRSRVEDDLEDELRDYFESEREHAILTGASAEETRLHMERIKEECRDTRGTLAIEHVVRDVCYSWRALCKDRLFTTVSLLTLALGIGANTTMFSVVNSVLLRPLPGYETDRLVRINDADRRYRAGFVAPELYLELAKNNSSFETIAGQQFCPFNLTGVGEPEQVMGPCTTANWFFLQHAQAFLGRTFAPDEDQRGRARVVVLDYAFWRRKFNGDPKVIGQAVTLNGAPWTVIGVMPPGFRPLGVTGAPAVFTPDVISDNPAGLIVVARLKGSVSLAAAQAELKMMGDRVVRANPGRWKGTVFTLTPVLEQLTGPQRPLLLLLMGAVSFVLLIACTNVANLLLARSKARQHEMEIRSALGASRRRLMQFLLTEVLLLCLAASVMAAGLAFLGVHALRPLLAYLPRAEEIAVDGRVFGWALAMGWLATFLAGALPAWRSAGTDEVGGMRMRSTLRWQNTLLTGEVALALVLLVGAGLLIRTFVNLRNAPLGYDPRNLLTAFISLPEQQSAPASAELLYGRIRQRLASLPGVQSVSTSTSTPAGGVDMSVPVIPEGSVVRPGEASATVNIVDWRYFRTLGIPIQAGRSFTPEDRAQGAPVVIVSESIARKYFGSHALGRRVQIPAVNFALTDAKMVWAEIVGVVENVAVTAAGESNAAHLYVPETQSPVRFTYILVRTAGDPMLLSSALRRSVYAESSMTPLDEVRSMEDRAAYLTAAPRRAMWLLGLFAGLAGLLSTVGIYAVSAYLSVQRSREMAIRMALGADALSIAAAVYRRPMGSILLGILLGSMSAVGLTRFLKALLFGVGTLDFPTYVGAAIGLFICALISMVRPTLRAVTIDAAQTLRQG